MILIFIKFCELLLLISLRTITAVISYIKHSKKCFFRYPCFFNPLLSVWASDKTLFLVFDITTSKDSLRTFKTELKSINFARYLNCMVICFTLIDPAPC